MYGSLGWTDNYLRSVFCSLNMQGITWSVCTRMSPYWKHTNSVVKWNILMKKFSYTVLWKSFILEMSQKQNQQQSHITTLDTCYGITKQNQFIVSNFSCISFYFCWYFKIFGILPELIISVGNKSFQNVLKMCLRTTLTNVNEIYDEIKRPLRSGNAYSVWKLLQSHPLSNRL
jgi:hypothetical protein